jgi:hypothetical protein
MMTAVPDANHYSFGKFNPGDSLVGGRMSQSLFDRFNEKNKPDEKVVTEPVVLSPSIKYAGCPKFATSFE